MGCPQDAHGMSKGCVHGMPTLCLWDAHGVPTGCLSCRGDACEMSHGIPWVDHGMLTIVHPMERPRDVHGMQAGCPRDGRGMSTISHGMPMGCLWDARGMPHGTPPGCPVGCPREAYGMPTGCARDGHGMSHVIPMECPLCSVPLYIGEIVG